MLGSLRGDPLEVFPTYLLRLPRDDARAAVDWATGDLLPKIGRRSLARFADVLSAHVADSPEDCARYLCAAREQGLALKVHAAGERCTEAIRLALAHQAVSVDDLDRIDEAGASTAGRLRTIATLTPGALSKAAAATRPACWPTPAPPSRWPRTSTPTSRALSACRPRSRWPTCAWAFR